MPKSEGFDPPRRTAEICKVAEPALVTVIVCGTLAVPWVVAAKLSVPGLNVIAGRGARPMPVSGTVCGLPGALSETVRLELREPA